MALLYIGAFLFVLTIIVFIHEMGHFLVARWCGVKVEAFSIGFGPEIVGWYDRYGTRWKLSWVPLGGYVKFLGDENEASAPMSSQELDKLSPEQREGLFATKPVWQRFAVVAAGPMANFLLAIAIFAATFQFNGREIYVPRISFVADGGAAQQAGFKADDLILSIDGRNVKNPREIINHVVASFGRTLEVKVRRADQELLLSVAGRPVDIQDRFGNKRTVYQIGLGFNNAGQPIETEHFNPATALWAGIEYTWTVLDLTAVYLRDIFFGQAPIQELGGPIRIAKVAGDLAKISFFDMFSLIPMLSISIGFLNLLPVPMLDGGHLVFYIVEAIRGRPVNERAQEFAFRIGFMLLIGLMVLTTWNDIPIVKQWLGMS
jgi:regulator of sigma E protease